MKTKFVYLSILLAFSLSGVNAADSNNSNF